MYYGYCIAPMGQQKKLQRLEYSEAEYRFLRYNPGSIANDIDYDSSTAVRVQFSILTRLGKKFVPVTVEKQCYIQYRTQVPPLPCPAKLVVFITTRSIMSQSQVRNEISLWSSLAFRFR